MADCALFMPERKTESACESFNKLEYNTSKQKMENCLPNAILLGGGGGSGSYHLKKVLITL